MQFGTSGNTRPVFLLSIRIGGRVRPGSEHPSLTTAKYCCAIGTALARGSSSAMFWQIIVCILIRWLNAVL